MLHLCYNTLVCEFFTIRATSLRQMIEEDLCFISHQRSRDKTNRHGSIAVTIIYHLFNRSPFGPRSLAFLQHLLHSCFFLF